MIIRCQHVTCEVVQSPTSLSTFPEAELPFNTEGNGTLQAAALHVGFHFGEFHPVRADAPQNHLGDRLDHVEAFSAAIA